MCEASREYKHNRQAFDQKARSMTEKCAHPGAGGNVGSSGCIQAYSNPIKVEAKKTENEHEANEYNLNCKKICGTSRKLKLQSSGSPERRVESDKGNGASNNLLSVKETENQMEVEETKKESKHTIHKSKSSQKKLKGNGRKLSLASFALSQKKYHSENEKLVPKNISSPICNNLSVASLGSPDYHMEEINQREDSVSKDENTNTEIKKLLEFRQKQQLGSSEVKDFSKEKILVTPQPAETHVIKSDEAASVTPAVNSSKLHPQKDCMERIGKAPDWTSDKRFSLVGNKLSLGCKGPSGTHNKENVQPPAYKRPRSSLAFSARGTVLCRDDEDYESGHGNLEKHGRDQKQSLGPLTQMQESTNNQIQPLSYSEGLLSSSKPMLKQPDRGLSENHCFDQGKDDKTSGQTKQKGEEVLTSDAVIVLDSERQQRGKECAFKI